MRPFITLIILAFSAFSPAFSQINDNFNDGNFSTNPIWTGNTTKFIINPSAQLQLNGVAATDTAYLSTSNTQINNTEWQFWLRMAFAGSSSNYVKVYLTADNGNLKSPLNGYYIRIGESGNLDGIDLYRQSGKTASKIIDGISRHAAKSNNILKIKVTRDNSGNWNLYADTLGNSNFIYEGTAFDNTFNTSAYFGISCKHSSSNRTKVYLDDVIVKPLVPDLTPPIIDSVKVRSAKSLDVFFSEPVETGTAETLANYVVNNGISNPNSAARDGINPSIVHLDFTSSFADGISNTLTLSNIQDESGNSIIINSSKSFIFLAPIIAKFGDVVINEIYADPSPTVGLPAVEYVELYNANTKPINLQSWKFSDGSTTAVFGSSTLAPNSFLIVCPITDTAAFRPYGKVLGINSFPSLNNGGDHLTLKSDSAVLIDDVSYSDKWYHDDNKDYGGWSLERINPGIVCSIEQNWIASNDSSGGTPGRTNSVYNTIADTTPPGISSINVIDSNHIRINFTENIDTLTAQNLSNYNCSLGSPLSVKISGNTEIIAFSAIIKPGVLYSISIANLKDCNGNNKACSSNFVIGKSPEIRDLVITEIFPDPDPSVNLPNSEFVEIYNRSSSPIEIGGCVIADATTNSTLDSAVILPFSYAIICSSSNKNSFEKYGTVLTTQSLPTQNNDGDYINLKTSSGLTLDELKYDLSFYHDKSKQEGGWTIERIDNDFPCLNELNWKASVNMAGGTPGTKNSVSDKFTDIQSPELLRANIVNDSTLNLLFSEIIDSVEAQKISNYTFDNGLKAPIKATLFYKSVLLTYHDSIKVGQIYTVVAKDIKDCSGNMISKHNLARFALSENCLKNDLVINEILFNPKPGSVDFVELFNRSSKVIDLKNILICSENIFRHELTTVPASDSSLLIFPGDYFAFTSNPKNIADIYPLSEKLNLLETELPSFNDDKGIVEITSKGSEIDKFSYSDKMHFPLLTDVEGVSLERVSPERGTQDSSSWHSAAESVGFATPGKENSQFQSGLAKNGQITIEPEVFSPDNDGYNDVLNIHYKLEKPGFVANVKIFDHEGRQIKELVKNETVSDQGVFSWDGIDENRSKSSMGIYIILTEVFDLQGKTITYKNTCVLGGKLN